jgi:hypothetical protein
MGRRADHKLINSVLLPSALQHSCRYISVVVSRDRAAATDEYNNMSMIQYSTVTH